MNTYNRFFVSVLFLSFSSVQADIERVSVSSSGGMGNSHSYSDSISADGRYAVFLSYANNLVPSDTNGKGDVFIHDRDTDTTELISKSSNGGSANDASFQPKISMDGRYVTFESLASNIVADDLNNSKDIFVHDRDTGITTLISMSSASEPGNAASFNPVISADGRYVVFVSQANNLVSNDVNNSTDVFIHDRETGITELISQSSNSERTNDHSELPDISHTGRYVVFASFASNLVSNDSNNSSDIFLHDRQTGLTSLISISSGGNQANSFSRHPSLSADGRYVAFSSNSNNLSASGDINGRADVFVHDRTTGTTELISQSSRGEHGNSSSNNPSISADGRFVTYYSFSNNLIVEDTNEDIDIFIHDRLTGETNRLSETSTGNQGNRNSDRSRISGNGLYVTFTSYANNLVPNDTNNLIDVFVVDNVLGKPLDLHAIVRPTSGAVAVDEFIRFRTLLTNTGSQTLRNCKVDIVNPYVKSIFKRRFSFYTWPLNISSPEINKAVDIAPGQTAKMNLVVLARDNYRGEVEFNYHCENARASTIPFVNTVHLVAKTDPIIAEDFIVLDTNGRSEVVIDQSNLFKYWYEYVVRVKNTGNDATSVNLTAKSSLIDKRLIRQPQFCERSDPSNPAVCAAPRSEQLQVFLAAGETKKVGVFVHAFRAIADRPVSNRINVEASDSTGEVVSTTSIQAYTIN